MDRSAKYRDGSPTLEHTSDSGRTYYLSMNSTAAKERGQKWSCDCQAWIITKIMPCKHLRRDPRVERLGLFKDGTNLVAESTSYLENEGLIARSPGRGRRGNQESTGQKPTPGGDAKPAPEATATAPPHSFAPKSPALMTTPFSQEEMKLGRKIRAGTAKDIHRHGFQLCHEFSRNHDRLGPGWVAEVKYDGQLAMFVDGRIIARSLNNITERFPEIDKISDAVVVGEICVLDEAGYSDFSKVLQRKRDKGIRIASLAMPATFIAFDILELNGNPLIEDLPFKQRRQLLEEYLAKRLPQLKGWRLIEQLDIWDNAQVEVFRKAAAEAKSEGWILKNPDSPHRAARTRGFLKVKTWQEQDFKVLALTNTVGEKGHPGLVATINTGQREQDVNIGGDDNKARIKEGDTITVKFLSKSEDGALRFPTLKRLKGEDHS